MIDGEGTSPPNSPRCRTSPTSKQERRDEATQRANKRQSRTMKRDGSLGRLGELQRGTSSQVSGTRSTGRRFDVVTHVGTGDIVVDVFDETIVLKGCGLNLDGARETAIVEVNKITSAIFNKITMTSTTSSLPVGGQRRLCNRSRLNGGGLGSTRGPRLLLPRFGTRRISRRRNRRLWFEGRGRHRRTVRNNHGRGRLRRTGNRGRNRIRSIGDRIRIRNGGGRLGRRGQLIVPKVAEDSAESEGTGGGAERFRAPASTEVGAERRTSSSPEQGADSDAEERT